MKYNTINTIIDDIMLEMRRNNITESESYSRKQIEQWVIQYRDLVLKEISNAKLPVSSNYYQEFYSDVDISLQNRIGSLDLNARSLKLKVPDYFCDDIGRRYISMFDLFGNEIQVMGKKRSKINRFSRHFSSSKPTAYVDSNKTASLDNADLISGVNVSGIFIDPTSVPGFDYDNEMYPIDPGVLPRIKQMIFQNELKYNLIPDLKNDGREAFVVAQK